MARRYLSYFQGDVREWTAPDQERLRDVVPPDRRRVYDIRRAVELLADEGSVLELRPSFAPGHGDGAGPGGGAGGRRRSPTTRCTWRGRSTPPTPTRRPGSCSCARPSGCPSSRCATRPASWSGPRPRRRRSCATSAACSSWGRRSRCPSPASSRARPTGWAPRRWPAAASAGPLFTVAWPTGELGGMGLEGAVRLGFRRELDASTTPTSGRRPSTPWWPGPTSTARRVHVAEHFEIDDVIDPAVTQAALRARARSGGTGTRTGRTAAVGPSSTRGDTREDGMTTIRDDIERLVGAMTLDEKASLTAGANLWYLPPVERLGIPSLKVSDGPSGVRGDSLIGAALAVDPLRHGRRLDVEPRARASASATCWPPRRRSKGVHVLLGPTVCIVRTPLAGRTFESFSEDPLLTARIAVAYVRGRAGRRGRLLHQALRLQRPGARADDDQRRGGRARPPGDPPRRLRSRRTGGRRLVRDDRLQQGQRRSTAASSPTSSTGSCGDEWGFDGLVMSDWFGTHSTGAGRAGRPRPRDAGAVGLARADAGRRGPRRARWTSRSSTGRCATSCG